MRKLATLMATVAVVALVVSAALAQQFGFGGFGTTPLTLLSQKSVQEELKLSEDQIKKVTELQEKQRSSFSFKDLKNLGKEEIQKKIEENRKAADQGIASILNADQHKRLKQINLQLQGTSRALSLPDVVEALKFSDEQKEKLKAIQEESRTAGKDLFKGGFNEETRKKLDELRKGTDEKALGLLTADQKTKWKDLTGEPFKGEITRIPFRPKNP